MDTWLDAVRNLRNYCAHPSMVVGMTSSVVIPDNRDSADVLSDNTNFYSRLYALKKILPQKDADMLARELEKLISKTKIDIYKMNVLPACIFRKNCASVPEERSAIPLQTEQSSAGLLVTVVYSTISARKFKTICLGCHSA